MNNQTFKIQWRLFEDYPTRDGEYLVCYQLDDGDYGDPSFMEFHRGNWILSESEDFPIYWAELRLPIK